MGYPSSASAHAIGLSPRTIPASAPVAASRAYIRARAASVLSSSVFPRAHRADPDDERLGAILRRDQAALPRVGCTVPIASRDGVSLASVRDEVGRTATIARVIHWRYYSPPRSVSPGAMPLHWKRDQAGRSPTGTPRGI